MNLKMLGPIFALLLAVGIIFGSYSEFESPEPFGFGWFTRMLWFAIGFPTLVIIGVLFFKLATKAEELIEEKE